MILKSLYLHNYRRYRDQTVEFPDGLIGIVGKNGTGKSTLIEAIGWCLYGKARSGQDEIRTATAPRGQHCMVRLEIEVGQDMFVVERKIAGTVVTASVHVNGGGRPEAAGSRGVSEFIARRTGMDHNAFVTSIFAQQKELDAFSDLNPAKRKGMAMRLLGIDGVESAIRRIREDVRSGRETIKTLESVSDDMGELEDEKTRYEEEVSRTKAQIRSVRAGVSDLGKREAALKRNLRVQEKLRDAHERASSALGVHTAREGAALDSLAQIKNDLEKAQEARREHEALSPQITWYAEEKRRVAGMDRDLDRFKKIQSYKRRIEELQREERTLQRQILRVETKIGKTGDPDADLEKNKGRIKALEFEKGEFDDIWHKAGQDAEHRKAEVSRIDGELEDIGRLGEDGRCPKCRRRLGDHLTRLVGDLKGQRDESARIMEEVKKEARSIKVRLDKITRGIVSARNNEIDITKRIKDRAVLRQKLEDHDKNVRDVRREIKSYARRVDASASLQYDGGEHERARSRLADLVKKRERILELHRDAAKVQVLEGRIKKAENKVSAARRNIKAYESKISEIGFDRDGYEEAKSKTEYTVKEHGGERARLVGLEKDLERITSSMEQICTSISKEIGRRKKIDGEMMRVGLLSRLEQIMEDFKAGLISRIRPILSAGMSDLLSRMTGGRYQDVELDKDYGIRIGDGGVSFGTARFSGGEQDLAGLCLRIAISQELADRAGVSGSMFIALDEIFGSQDADRKALVLGVLSQISTQFRQVLLITHIEDIKESLPYALHVVEEPSGAVRIDVEGIPPG